MLSRYNKVLIGVLILIFFALMALDISTWLAAEPTDTHVEAVCPEIADSLYHNEDSYPVSSRPVTF